MVRIGLALYGIAQGKLDLKPVLSLLARISQIQKIQADEAVGYNLSWQAETDSTIALLPLGYADGVKRGLSNRIKGLLKGNYISQIGTISMDQITFDVTVCENEVKAGDVITLIGSQEEKNIEMREWAQILNTIEYEIACDLRARLPKVYVRK
jgi:alanine racemase